MKKLYRKIEEDISNIGVDEVYPTQFIIDADSLVQIGNLVWENPETSFIFFKINRDDQLRIKINGLSYESVSGYERLDDNFLIDNVEQCNGKIGFYLYEVDDKAIDLGLELEDGMDSKHDYMNEYVVAIENYYRCDGPDSIEFGLKCMTFEEGHVLYEPFVTTGDYKTDNHINYNEELIDYISNKKVK